MDLDDLFKVDAAEVKLTQRKAELRAVLTQVADPKPLRQAVLTMANSATLHAGMRPNDVEWLQKMQDVLKQWGKFTEKQGEATRRVVLRYLDLYAAYMLEKEAGKDPEVSVPKAAAERETAVLAQVEGFGDF